METFWNFLQSIQWNWLNLTASIVLMFGVSCIMYYSLVNPDLRNETLLKRFWRKCSGCVKSVLKFMFVASIIVLLVSPVIYDGYVENLHGNRMLSIFAPIGVLFAVFGVWEICAGIFRFIFKNEN